MEVKNTAYARFHFEVFEIFFSFFLCEDVIVYSDNGIDDWTAVVKAPKLSSGVKSRYDDEDEAISMSLKGSRRPEPELKIDVNFD